MHEEPIWPWVFRFDARSCLATGLSPRLSSGRIQTADARFRLAATAQPAPKQPSPHGCGSGPGLARR